MPILELARRYSGLNRTERGGDRFLVGDLLAWPGLCARTTPLLLLACLAVISCGGTDDTVAPLDPPRAAAISISPATADLSYVGETATFQAPKTK